MKKLIAMVMTATMVASLLPATAFAASGELIAKSKGIKLIDKIEESEDFQWSWNGNYGPVGGVDRDRAPEVQISLDELDALETVTENIEIDVTFELENAVFFDIGADINWENLEEMSNADEAKAILLDSLHLDGITANTSSANYSNGFTAFIANAGWAEDSGTPGKVEVWDSTNSKTASDRDINVEVADFDEESVTFTLTIDKTKVAEAKRILEDAVLGFDLAVVMEDTNPGDVATVSVYTDIVGATEKEDIVFIEIMKEGITASTKKVAVVAEEESASLDSDLKIKSNVGNFVDNQIIEVKTSKGFEFPKFTTKTQAPTATKLGYEITWKDDNLVWIEVDATGVTKNLGELTIDKDHIKIEAATAKSGASCTLTLNARDWNASGTDINGITGKATVEVMTVVDYKVILSVDEDDDVPVIYNGVDVDNYGINDDSDHWSLEVTAEETFPGAWSFRKGFNFELPEGVYVADVDVLKAKNFLVSDTDADGTSSDVGVHGVENAFWDAYQDGDHVNFEFDKRVFDDVDTQLNKEKATMTFKLQLVADPDFVGDVVLKLTGDLVDEQEVTVAKFVAPYEVKAEQNDLKIDYRYTEIPTNITITEAEEGLWAKDEAAFYLTMDHAASSFLEFEDADVTVNSGSDMEVDDKVVNNNGSVVVKIDRESDGEAAVVTVENMSLFMSRSIPAGPYDLTIYSSLANAYEAEILFAPDCKPAGTYIDKDSYSVTDYVKRHFIDQDKTVDVKNDDTYRSEKADTFVADVCDYEDVIQEAFVNVVTAGRDKDDATFTTKVVVPVGADEITVGDKTMKLTDIATGTLPAYINAKGFTMLPVRVVAVALGIDYENVVWSQADQRVTILYGQRVITMQVGDNNIYVNAAPVAAYSGVEIKDGRAYLSLRDLGRALGVNDIAWDASTKTATLNGGNTAE